MERIDGKRLEAIRNYRGMSINDIVRKTGVSYQTIADIETGFTKGPQFVTLSKNLPCTTVQGEQHHHQRKGIGGCMAITTETPEKLTVSIAEASTISGFSRVVIRTAIKRGELKSLLPHGYVRGRRIKKAELLKWMREMEV